MCFANLRYAWLFWLAWLSERAEGGGPAEPHLLHGPLSLHAPALILLAIDALSASLELFIIADSRVSCLKTGIKSA